jgi:predicted O-linked N-acetylglucosamine transferase (SPINDLY family)
MDNWQIPLAVATLAFFAFLLFKVRPVVFPSRKTKEAREALRQAKEHIENAKNDEERALALCDAADASIAARAGMTSAIGFYLRAMRTNPRSAEIVERAAQSLARRPRALENLLWRRLGAEEWRGDAAKAALRHLATLYSGPLKSAVRAKALENALASVS